MKKNKKFEILCWLLAALPVVAVAACLPTLPDAVPMHWNVAGEVDRWGSKWELFLMAALPLAMNFLFLVMPHFDPKKENYKKFGKVYDILRLVTIVFMAVMLGAVLVSCYRPGALPLEKVVCMGLGVLYLIIGNYMPKVKDNYYVGIKTPWTLANKRVWNKTHRLGGYCFVAAGVLVLAAAVVTKGFPLFAAVMVSLVLCLVPVVASWFFFKKEEQKGAE